tara:strand:- start:39 stop:227 length:189 start_codon:yes stop_codon:yes gene_type:complete
MSKTSQRVIKGEITMFCITTRLKLGNAEKYVQVYASTSLVSCRKKIKEMQDLGLNDTFIEEK